MENSEYDLETFKEPSFWQEDWLKCVIDALDIRKMNPKERTEYEMSLIRGIHELTPRQEEIIKLKTHIAFNMLSKGFDMQTIREILTTSE